MADASALAMYAAAGYHLTPLKGKVPVKKDWPKSPYLATPVAEAFPENFGVVLQDSDLVVDIDPRNYKTGENSLQRLQKDLGWKVNGTKTPVVATGGGGYHVYLKKPADFAIVNGLAQYPGVEFKTKGAQVVGARCVHPETKKFYNLMQGEFSHGSIPQAPKNLLELIRKNPTTKALSAHPVVSGDAQTALRFAEYCQQAPEAVQGQNGDKTTFAVACKGRDLGLPEALTAEIMGLHYNPRCQPPWTIEELAVKVVNAYSYAQNTPGNLNPAADFTAMPSTPKPTFHWDLTGEGALKKTLNNCVNFFMDPASGLASLVAWDEFTDQVMIIQRAPWHPDTQRIPKDGLPWTDEDMLKCRYYLSKVKKFDVNSELVMAAVVNAAAHRPNHPVRNYLNALVWDGVPRVNAWLAEYCGVANTSYAQAVGAKTLLGAVARVYQPGVKFDYMLVIEGDQGIGKSTVVSVLGGPWYGDLMIDPHDKDTLSAMRGKWIIEASEMAFTTYAEAQAQKAFLSRQKDTFRAAYARNTKDVQRQCVFIGTINVDAEGGYLKDTTGNRRFWPVRATKMETARLKADRDQLFAETVHRYKNGESLYLDSPEVEAQAGEEQRSRQHTDPWTDKIAHWLDNDQFGVPRNIVTSMEVWTDCLNGLEKQLDRKNQIRISQVLKAELKWAHGSHWSPTLQRVVKGFKRPGYDGAREQLAKKVVQMEIEKGVIKK